MVGGDIKAQVDISDLIADHDPADAIDLVVLLQDALPVDLSELVGGSDPQGVLRVEAIGLGEGEAAPVTASPPLTEGFSPVPFTIIFDDAATDPTTAI